SRWDSRTQCRIGTERHIGRLTPSLNAARKHPGSSGAVRVEILNNLSWTTTVAAPGNVGDKGPGRLAILGSQVARVSRLFCLDGYAGRAAGDASGILEADEDPALCR